MPSLAQLFATQLDGADWLQVLAGDAALLHAVDAFLSRACAAQAKRIEPSGEELHELQDDARVGFALYARLLAALEIAQPLKTGDETAMRATLLHVARLLPFCQLFAQRSPQRVRALLDAAATHIEEFKGELKRLTRVYAEHLDHIHRATLQNKRNQIVDLIQTVYETSLSIHALSLSQTTLEILFGGSEDAALATGSLVRALAVCYEADVPVLQRSLAKLDEKAQKKAALLVPESRRVLLTILDSVFQAAMKREKAQSGSGEGVLMTIHELSHSTDAEIADHGSFISDLWHLCGYEAKLLEFFDDIKLDRDSVSYLEVILDGLPRRRVLDEAEHKIGALAKGQATGAAQPTEPSSRPSSDHTSGAPATSELSSLVAQVQDLFPDLGDGYVALCLLSSQNQVETVINYLLESNPPPVVSSVRTNLKRSDVEYATLERTVLGKEGPAAASAAPAAKSEKVDPNRIWKGKRAMEKHYDPQVARKDPSIVEKVMQIVDEYAEEDNFREAARQQSSGETTSTPNNDDSRGGFVLDEYDDDYNDEFEDYEPFSVHDGGQVDDFDAIRHQNRRLRELEAEDAFWEGMRNQNRRAVDVADDDEDGEDDDEDAESQQQGSTQWARGPSRGEWKPQASGGAANAPRRGGPPRGGAADGAPMMEQQQQRQRQRDNKNKAKVGNHHRKDRALKKRG